MANTILMDPTTGYVVNRITTNHGMSIDDALALSPYELSNDTTDDDQLSDRETGELIPAWYGLLELIPYDDAAELMIGHTWAAIEGLMDDELREQIAKDWYTGGAHDFLRTYMQAHKERFGEDFTIN